MFLVNSWGQRIPAYFYDGNKYVVAETASDALKLAQAENSVSMEDLRQDEDVLDTWFLLGCGLSLFLMELKTQTMKK